MQQILKKIPAEHGTATFYFAQVNIAPSAKQNQPISGIPCIGYFSKFVEGHIFQKFQLFGHYMEHIWNLWNKIL